MTEYIIIAAIVAVLIAALARVEKLKGENNAIRDLTAATIEAYLASEDVADKALDAVDKALVAVDELNLLDGKYRDACDLIEALEDEHVAKNEHIAELQEVLNLRNDELIAALTGGE